MAAIEGLVTNPAITANFDAAKAVTDTKSRALTIASIAFSSAAALVAEAQTASDTAIDTVGAL